MAKWLKLFKVLSRALVACGSEPHFSIGRRVEKFDFVSH